MDGVLYNSMAAHAKSWQQTMEEFGLKNTRPEDFYLHEGRPAEFTIGLLIKQELKRDATQEEIDRLYARKSELFGMYNTDGVMENAQELLNCTKAQGLTPVLVTGSKQPTLLDRLEDNFPGIFLPETMVTAFTTKIGKPHPEPFLIGLEKAGNLQPNQALVIENAPLGVESAHKAGIFTIAVNTGPLSDSLLEDAGADMVLPSVTELYRKMPEILHLTREISL